MGHPMSSCARWFLVLASLTAAIRAAEAPPASPAQPVRLAVVISVDQLRADYLVRFRPWFVEGGFKRLLAGGADFRNAHYRHSQTVTAPGHATILTGVHANVHGITGNDWLDRATWTGVSNVEDHDAPLLGITPQELGPAAVRNPQKTGRSPRNLKAYTVSDQLKLRYGVNGKVFAASNKDRSAILLGGKLADGAYWDELGVMVSSTYYGQSLPAWVAAFNAEKRVQAYFGRTWERLLPAEIYDAVQGPDDAAGETVDVGFTRTFPKVVNGGESRVSGRYFSAFDASPFSAEFLGEFALRGLREEKLGLHAGTDMFCVSFSQIDSVGHAYGPDSHEVMDSMLRLDRVVAGLLDAIDRQVGLANCVVVLSSDHGVAPLPEHITALRKGVPAGRARVGSMDMAVTQALNSAYGALPENEGWYTRNNGGYHLRPTALAAKKLAADDVAKIVKSAVGQQEFIAAVFTRAELLAIEPAGDTLPEMVRRSYYAPSDRDVVYVLKPYYMDKGGAGTTHGSPYAYDTNVPVVFYGRGVPAGVHAERVGVDDIAPTLAGLLGIPAPPEAKGRRLF